MSIPKGQATSFKGKRYRMCVYPTANGWGGFVEDARHYLGGTGECPSRRVALIKAAWIVRAASFNGDEVSK